MIFLNTRIKELRKALGLTMEKFGEKIGVKKAAISKLEKGENNVSDQMFKSICREFNVSEEWLRTGEGEMFQPKDSEAELHAMIERVLSGKNDHVKTLFKIFAKLDDEYINALDNILDKLLAKDNSNADSVLAKNDVTDIYNELPDTAEEFEQQYPVIDDDSKNAG